MLRLRSRLLCDSLGGSGGGDMCALLSIRVIVAYIGSDTLAVPEPEYKYSNGSYSSYILPEHTDMESSPANVHSNQLTNRQSTLFCKELYYA